MKSHTCEFVGKDLLRLLGGPILTVGLFAGLMHAGTRLGIWPAPRPTLDVDRTILIHQVEASRQNGSAEILLIGDSSCLMDVNALQLSEALGRRVLNLGALSYLDLEAYGDLLRSYLAWQSTPPQLVVLLMHPEALRRISPEPYHVQLLEALLKGERARGRDGFYPRLSRWLGLEDFQTRLFSRCVPTPLGGAYGRFYGFSRDLEYYLTQHLGSAVDPDPQPFQGNAEYRLAKSLETVSGRFRETVPDGVQLVVGITPVPEGFAQAGFAKQQKTMLNEWSRWLKADAILDRLPAMMPEADFVKTTHLSETGAATYTGHLAEELKKLLP